MQITISGFGGLGVYVRGNYGERNEKDASNIIRRRREKSGTRRGEEENAGKIRISLFSPPRP